MVARLGTFCGGSPMPAVYTEPFELVEMSVGALFGDDDPG